MKGWRFRRVALAEATRSGVGAGRTSSPARALVEGQARLTGPIGQTVRP